MEPSTYLAFVFLAAAQVATPGPSTLFLVSNAVVHGRARALVALSGDLAAIALLASLSAVGLAQVLATSPSVFMALQIGGAVYMLWLGWTYLRPQPALPKAGVSATTDANDRDLWIRSFAIGLSTRRPSCSSPPSSRSSFRPAAARRRSWSSSRRSSG